MNFEKLELFQTVCFLTTMEHGNGLIDKHPSYITEKKKTCKSSLAAWQMLDWKGQLKILKWANKFGFPIQDCIHEISKEVRLK